MNMIHQTIIVLVMVVGFFANTAWAANSNVLCGTHIKKILTDKIVAEILKESGESTGSEYLAFVGVVRSETQLRDGKVRYDLLFDGQPGAKATQCALTVKLNLSTKKVEALTKEEVQDAMLPCVNF